MKFDSPNTIRNRLRNVCSFFKTIDIALFSTFNFNGDFFEENVLPTLFGIDDDASRAVRSREVHKLLAKTSVGVIYDPSVAKYSGKAYRYTHYPVFIPGRLFHPKNIFLIGSDEKGNRWIYVATLSGNLSLSGWGSNCEVMADTWIHSKSEQPWLATNQYLLWLVEQFAVKKRAENPLSKATVLMADGIRKKRTLDDPEGVSWSSKNFIRLYFSPLHTSFWKFAFEDIKEISMIKVASPYWGSVNECIALLGKEVPSAENIDVALVMGYLPPLMSKTGLGIDERNGLKVKLATKVEFYLWKNEAGRFHHLKLFRFKTDKGIVSAVGSCNFTRPGLFWNFGKNEGKKGTGNVESMMLDRQDGIEWPIQVASESDFDDKSTADDAPKPWPFFVMVTYDWRSREYAWSLSGNLGEQSASLKLCDFEVSINKTSKVGKRAGKLTSTVYVIKSEEYCEMIGCVIELNLDESTREYSTPLVTEVILQSWLQGAVNEPVPGIIDELDDELGIADTKESLAVISDESASVFFEFYDFYRATAGFEKKLLASVTEDEILDLLLWRSDSVRALGIAIVNSKQSAAVKYLVLTECIRLMKSNKEAEKKLVPFVNQMQSNIDEYRLTIIQELSRDTDKAMSIESEELLGWYEQRLRSDAI